MTWPVVTRSRAMWLAALAAAVVYVGATNNQWALDDELIVRDNPAAHSVAAASDAFFAPYWPFLQGVTAGLYRPFTILTYGIDWSLSEGSAAWFHATNVLMHGLTTALFVAVVLAWLPPVAALVAGFVFAVHPVHVEAVANVVGRAEILVAGAVLGAVLSARRFRRAVGWRARTPWLFLTVALLLIGMLSKEHGIVGIGVVFIDDLLDSRSRLRESLGLYLAAAVGTAGWFVLWQGVAGAFVGPGQAATLAGLGPVERLATMLPVQLDVVRLLAWPMDLVADYNPQVIQRRTEWSWLATAGLLLAGAVVALAFLAARRAPAVSFGILAGIATYAPTSNLVFGSGIPLAERNLYVAAIAPAAVLGWLTIAVHKRARPWVGLGIGSLLLFFSVRTVTRIPFWYDSETVVLRSAAEHPENYRHRIRLAGLYRRAGPLGKARAFSEYMAAGAIYPEDPFVATYTVPLALELGYTDIALREAERAYAMEPGHAALALWLTSALVAVGDTARAWEVAGHVVGVRPDSPLALRVHLVAVDGVDEIGWAGHFARARLQEAVGDTAAASAYLDSGLTSLPSTLNDLRWCREIDRVIPLARRIRPGAIARFDAVRGSVESVCAAGL